MRPKGNKFQRRQVGLCETVLSGAGLNSAVGRFKFTERLPASSGVPALVAKSSTATSRPSKPLRSE
jgi:hypothetical protein